MTRVKVGSASIDENGKAHGGKAGNQTGRELKSQNWYLHKKGWRVFRAKDPKVAADICYAMKRAIANKKIGYDQWQRNTLYNYAEKVGFDPGKVTIHCETDCSALVRVCCAYAGIIGLPGDFRTGNMPANLLKTGAFTELTGSEYTKESSYLGAGDILVTKTSGHTVVVLNNGSNYAKVTSANPMLKKGDRGTKVIEMQKLLIAKGYSLPKYGADGDFGRETLKAVKSFQIACGLEVDGIVGEKTWEALRASQAVKTVLVTGSSVNVRSGAGTNFRILFIAHKGDELSYISTATNGWYKVEKNGVECYISNKYSELK